MDTWKNTYQKYEINYFWFHGMYLNAPPFQIPNPDWKESLL